MILKDIVPWGRNRDEYIKMFKLTKKELTGSILGCGDGPSSFNSESNGHVISVDPVYNYTKDEIRVRIDKTCEVVCRELENNHDDFVWNEFSNVQDLKSVRLNAMSLFLEDYDKGKSEGRYITGALPELSFSDKSFDLVLSSHFLFLYSQKLSLKFHIDSIKEMLRVGRTVKIFPLCDLNSHTSPHMVGVTGWLDENGYPYKIEEAEYEFQKGGNKYLYISSL